MRKRLCATTAFGVWVLCAAATLAQETTISLGSVSSDRLQADLKAIVELAPAPLNAQWPNLKNVLDSFVEGVDTARPMGLDITFGKTELGYVLKIPVSKMDGRGGFINNVQAFGFKVTGPDAAGIYDVEQVKAAPRGPRRRPATPAPAAPPAKPFYMKEVAGHAILAPSKDLLKGKLADPAPQLVKMLSGETDIAASLKNDAAGMAGKRATFKELRKQLEAAVEFRRGETQDELKLRKLALEQNLNEAERFVIESEDLHMQWISDMAKAAGHGDLSLTALAGTPLENSIKILAVDASKFENLKFKPKATLQLRVNFAVDEMRSQHAADLYAALLPVIQADVDKRPNLTATGKATGKEAVGKLFGMLNESIPLKVLDTFIDIHASSDGKNTGICAIRTMDGTKATPILAMFPQIREGWKFKADIAEHGGVKIHELTVAPHRKEEFQAVFGGPEKILVGVSKDIVWGAAGEGRLEELQAAIDQVASPAAKANPEFVQCEVRFAPWIKLLDVMRAKSPPSQTTDKEQLEFEKQRDKTRKYALQTLSNDGGVLKAVLKRQGDEVVGSLDVRKDLLTFIGTMIADFTAENLR